MQNCNQICFLSGSPQSGKTSFLLNVVDRARGQGYNLGGFTARGLWQDNRRSGFILQTLADGREIPLAGRSAKSKECGGFIFYPTGFAAGLAALTPRSLAGKNLVAVDEVGWLENSGDGWAAALPYLTGLNVKQIWVVRDAMVAEVCQKWQIKPGLLLNASDTYALKQILSWLNLPLQPN